METEPTTSESLAENLRLSLAKLGKLKLPVTPINYALVNYYVSGQSMGLNKKLDLLFEDMDNWSDTTAELLFSEYICQCTNEQKQAMEQELLDTFAHILGIVVELASKTSSSSSYLEEHMVELSKSKEPEDILKVASSIIAETKNLVQTTKTVESSLLESTQEIQSLKGELDDARREATVDALTKLHNRRGFDYTIQKSIHTCNSKGTHFCLMLLDIDHFKTVNDTHGHLIGDKVLKAIAAQLQRQMRGNDYLARYGGEEFAIILPRTPINGAFTAAENLRKSVGNLHLKQVKSGDKISNVSISIGVASYRKGETEEHLISRTDDALYRAKSGGRNRCMIAD